MSVWYAIPSARPPEEAMKCLSAWQDSGYKVAVQRDEDAQVLPVDLCVRRPYEGYARAVNHMARLLLDSDDWQWLVIGGDDVWPDPDHDPEEIADSCTIFFKGTLGVMQPTGDRFMEDAQGRCGAERVCISPWLGREWCERAYEGKGPLFKGFRHEYVDQDLHEVALKHGKLWHRPDITHYHDWYGRKGQPKPPHLRGKEKWNREGERLFKQRKAAGFPNSGFKQV